MKIRINKSQIDLTPKLKQHIETRVALAFGRFADCIRLVQVKFTKGKVHGSAPESCCQIEVSLNRKVSVEAADTDEFAAVDRALGQATRRISRVLEEEVASGGSIL